MKRTTILRQRDLLLHGYERVVVAGWLLLSAVQAHASTPPSHEVTVPTVPGQTVTVEWTGTVQPGNDQLFYVDPAYPTCRPETNPGAVALGDDQHLIQLAVPAGAYEHVQIKALFEIEWDDINQDIGLSVLRDGVTQGDSNGSAPFSTASEAVLLGNPAMGSYEIISCATYVITPTPYRGKLTLTAEIAAPVPNFNFPPAAGPGDARYQQQQAPAGIGEDTLGEMSIGYNPHTGRYMLLNYLQTLRMTLAEDLQDPIELPLKLPENCPALWEDVSSPTTNAGSFDPILSTDPQTGRTFVSQLVVAGGNSIYAYSDDDGDTWTQGSATLAGGHDHQTLVSGPYVPDQGPLPSANGYPNVVTYCSAEPAGFATCIRSDDGGLSFGAPAPVASAADCGDFFGFLGHLRYGADGTIYVPNTQCNARQIISVSEDSGRSFEVRENPNATPPDSSGLGSHGAVAVSQDGGTLYHCYINLEGQVRVSVSHDKARSWDNDSDIGAAAGIAQGVFPALVAGDTDRATCGFVGTTTPGNYEAGDFAGIWHVYMATTYDGGKSWRTVIASPGNPVQGMGGICTSGFDCGANRNLLDFNEMVMDERGYPTYAYDDGCVGACDSDPAGAPTYVAKAAFTRQVGGRGLIAQFDPVEPAVPHRSCLAGSRSKTGSMLTWPEADSSGSAISGYKIYRGTELGNLSQIASVSGLSAYTDVTADPATPYYYKISALNSMGESLKSQAVLLPPTSDAVPAVTANPAISNPSFGGAMGLGSLCWIGLLTLLRRRHGIFSRR